MNRKLSTPKTISGIVAALLVLIAAQCLALAAGEILLRQGIPGAICNVIIGVIYAALVCGLAALVCGKLLKVSIRKMRLPGFSVRPIWLAAAVLMPLLLLGCCRIAGGHWERNFPAAGEAWAIVTGAVVFYGFAAGLAEEIVFRGLIMGCLEKRLGVPTAVLLPSLLFGAVHIIGNDLDPVSALQVLAAGSIVGILFSLIALESGSVWNSALVHGVWNLAVVGGIWQIGTAADPETIFSFVLDNTSFWISGGEFGIEASVLSVGIYLAFSVLAALRMKKKAAV